MNAHFNVMAAIICSQKIRNRPMELVVRDFPTVPNQNQIYVTVTDVALIWYLLLLNFEGRMWQG
jgi:hypothetical protein